ncbi:MAG: diphthine--ammonia ligase [Candidatus Woesearchaeota archaeon]
MKLSAMVSGGKDSLYSLYYYHILGHDIKSIIKVKSENQYSWMFHSAKIDFVDIQAKLLKIPKTVIKTEGEKEKELIQLKKGLKKIKKKYGIEGIIVGAIDSDYQRMRIARICQEIGLKVFTPLWRKEYKKYNKILMDSGFKYTLSKIMCDGINTKWIGKEINKSNYKELEKELIENKVNVVYEGGEAETLVLNMPLFKKEIRLIDYDIKKVDDYDWDLIINNYELCKK